MLVGMRGPHVAQKLQHYMLAKLDGFKRLSTLAQKSPKADNLGF
jgi:hypothetical protein